MTDFEKQLEEIAKNAESRSLGTILNSDPHPSWIKEREDIKRADGKNWQYIPIEIIEDLLDHFYPAQWSLDISTSRANGEVAVNVNLRLPSRHLGGIAALPIRAPEEIEGAYQNCKSFAIKDAADHLGRLFGRDLNRGLEPEKKKKEKENGASIAYNTNRAKVLEVIEKCSTLASLKLKEKYREEYNVGEFLDKKFEELNNKEKAINLGF